MPYLPKTDKVLSSLLDMRIPLTFNQQDCELIADIIVEVVGEVVGGVVSKLTDEVVAEDL